VWRALAIAIGCASCRIGFDPLADALGAWSTPQVVEGASSPQLEEFDCTMSSTKTEIIFAIRPAGGTLALHVMTRPSADADVWSTPQLLVELDTAVNEATPRLSPDDLVLYFQSDRGNAIGQTDIWRSSRSGPGASWSPPVKLDEVTSPASDRWFAPCADGRYVLVRDQGMTGADLLEGMLGGGSPTVIAALSSPGFDSSPYLTPDCLSIYFASDRSGSTDLFEAHRSSVAEPWLPPTPVADFNTGFNEEDPWISRDARLFLFSRNVGATSDLYIAAR
jgi:Tol biopolymer transport system component